MWELLINNYLTFKKIKKSCIKCFLWSILTYLHPANDRYVDRLSKYKAYENEFDFKGITNFPMYIKAICKFDNKYNIKVRFFEISGN